MEYDEHLRRQIRFLEAELELYKEKLKTEKAKFKKCTEGKARAKAKLVDVLKEAIPVWEPNNAREEAYKDGCRAAVYFVQRKMFLLKESSREQLE